MTSLKAILFITVVMPLIMGMVVMVTLELASILSDRKNKQ